LARKPTILDTPDPIETGKGATPKQLRLRVDWQCGVIRALMSKFDQAATWEERRKWLGEARFAGRQMIGTIEAIREAEQG
jgi:hypothetical protein